jgi:PAS domain S-box-containing protein
VAEKSAAANATRESENVIEITMAREFQFRSNLAPGLPGATTDESQKLDFAAAEAVLQELAIVFFQDSRGAHVSMPGYDGAQTLQAHPEETAPTLEARYRALVEQISAIVFMAYLDRGIGEAYVSPQIEATLGFSQEEWLEDPVRWYQQIHPDDKQRWSVEASEMFLTGKPLRSTYRVHARDGHVVWFQCEAKMVRRPDGRPWFVQGIAFDVTELKEAEAALSSERNVLSAILDTVGALVVVLDPEGRIVRFNRACELTTGYSFDEVNGKLVWELFSIPEELESTKAIFAELRTGRVPGDYESHWLTRNAVQRRIAWSSTILPQLDGSAQYMIATGIDITERRRLQQSILEVSGREQRRIGQDLHDGLGQHLTGIAFMSKVLEQKLAERSMPETADADKILRLVNEAISRTRELARGLSPVVSEAHGLMSALGQLSNEIEDLFRISCRCECDEPVLIDNVDLSTHLYHIAQEAVNNAIKHGKAKHIVIRLGASNDSGMLTISDDGAGFPNNAPRDSGMGLHIMAYRANMIGGTLQVGPGESGGAKVACTFPLSKKQAASREA